MPRTLTIGIKSIEQGLGDFSDTFEAVRAGRRMRRREGVYFTSLAAARNLLTPHRLALLRAIRRKRPGSIYELAKVTGRDLKNVQNDLRLLEQYGLVRMGDGHSSGKRKVRIPQAVFDEISLKIAI